jgi:two-component system, NarL family, nitrate/nitrite response regulator NarL
MSRLQGCLMPVRVLIVEDSDVVRHSVCSLLQDSANFDVVGEANDGVQGISQTKTLQPDVILLDLSMPILNGLGAAPRMLQVSPDSKILMFSYYDSAHIVTASLNAGALGYVVKSDAGKDLLAGLLATSLGKQFVSSGVVAGGQI